MVQGGQGQGSHPAAVSTAPAEPASPRLAEQTRSVASHRTAPNSDRGPRQLGGGGASGWQGQPDCDLRPFQRFGYDGRRFADGAIGIANAGLPGRDVDDDLLAQDHLDLGKLAAGGEFRCNLSGLDLAGQPGTPRRRPFRTPALTDLSQHDIRRRSIPSTRESLSASRNCRISGRGHRRWWLCRASEKWIRPLQIGVIPARSPPATATSCICSPAGRTAHEPSACQPPSRFTHLAPASRYTAVQHEGLLEAQGGVGHDRCSPFRAEPQPPPRHDLPRAASPPQSPLSCRTPARRRPTFRRAARADRAHGLHRRFLRIARQLWSGLTQRKPIENQGTKMIAAKPTSRAAM